MSVIARRVVSTPERTTAATWQFITALVCQDDTTATKDFEAVAGLAAASISEEALRENALVVVGKGARLRVYCLHGDDAISGDQRSEDALTWKPVDGEWKAYLPCTEEDFGWMEKAIAAKSGRFVAYDIAEGLPEDLRESSETGIDPTAKGSLNINVGRFNEL